MASRESFAINSSSSHFPILPVRKRIKFPKRFIHIPRSAPPVFAKNFAINSTSPDPISRVASFAKKFAINPRIPQILYSSFATKKKEKRTCNQFTIPVKILGFAVFRLLVPLVFRLFLCPILAGCDERTDEEFLLAAGGRGSRAPRRISLCISFRLRRVSSRRRRFALPASTSAATANTRSTRKGEPTALFNIAGPRPSLASLLDEYARLSLSLSRSLASSLLCLSLFLSGRFLVKKPHNDAELTLR